MYNQLPISSRCSNFLTRTPSLTASTNPTPTIPTCSTPTRRRPGGEGTQQKPLYHAHIPNCQIHTSCQKLVHLPIVEISGINLGQWLGHKNQSCELLPFPRLIYMVNVIYNTVHIVEVNGRGEVIVPWH